MIDCPLLGASVDFVSHYFTDRLAAVYMHQQFGFRFEDHNGRLVVPHVDANGLCLLTQTGEVHRVLKAYISPGTVPLLEPQHGDLVQYADGMHPWGLYDGNRFRAVEKTIRRDDKPFFWPEREIRAHTEREEWRPITNYECIYEVSNFGYVRRTGKARGAIPGTILKPWLGTDGYLMVMLRNDGDDQKYPVHKLVAAAFLGPRPAGYHINHISGVKTENKSSNLEYVTPLDNYRHAAALGNWHLKLMPDDVLDIRRQFASGRKIAHIAKDFNISAAYCSHIVNRLQWRDI